MQRCGATRLIFRRSAQFIYFHAGHVFSWSLTLNQDMALVPVRACLFRRGLDSKLPRDTRRRRHTRRRANPAAGRPHRAANETPNETRLYGTKGGLRFLNRDSHEVEFFYNEHGEPRKEILTVDTTAAPDDHLALTTHFLDCLDGKAEPLMAVQRAAKHMEILFKILDA
jgi:hypothetical protein